MKRLSKIFLLLLIQPLTLVGQSVDFVETPWEKGEAYTPPFGGDLSSAKVSIAQAHRHAEGEKWPQFYYDKNDVQKKENEKSTKYRLRIGDELYVSLYGYEDGDTGRQVLVDPTGKIDYLFVNSVYALGKTIDQLRRDLQEKISDLFPNVVVSITALNLYGDHYTIMGEVKESGTHVLAGEMTVLKAIANAGGFPIRNFRGQVIDYADLDRAFLARNGDYIPIDFKRMIRDGDTSQDIPLKGGDYIFIPPITFKEICVLGAVNRSFVYSYLQPASLLEVLTWSGGVTEEASHRAAIIRGSLCNPICYLVDWKKIAKGCAPDFPLCPGDIVYFPPQKFLQIKNVILNAIRVFVGAFSIRFAEDAFESINPNFRRDNGVVIFNPALNPSPVIPPTTVIVP